MLYVLDTCIVIYLLRNTVTGQAIASRHGWTGAPHDGVISTVTVGELNSLAITFDWGTEKLRRLDAFVAAVTQIEISHPDILRAYGEIDSYSKSIGRKMGKNDAWIAATAAATGATLLSADKDFAHIPPTALSVVRIDPNTGLVL